MQVDGDGKLGAHPLGNVDRQVIEQAAICVKIVAGVYGSKDPGQRHGGPHSQGKRAIMKDVLPAGVELGCHAGKGSGQVVETLDLRVRKRHVVEDKAHFLPCIEAFGQLNAFSQPKLDPRRKFDLRPLFADRKGLGTAAAR